MTVRNTDASAIPSADWSTISLFARQALNPKFHSVKTSRLITRLSRPLFVTLNFSSIYRLLFISNHSSTLTASPHLRCISTSHLFGTFPNLYVFIITSSNSRTSSRVIVSGTNSKASSWTTHHKCQSPFPSADFRLQSLSNSIMVALVCIAAEPCIIALVDCVNTDVYQKSELRFLASGSRLFRCFLSIHTKPFRWTNFRFFSIHSATTGNLSSKLFKNALASFCDFPSCIARVLAPVPYATASKIVLACCL